MISLKKAKRSMIYFNLDPNVIPLDEWHYGLNVELEHGERNKLTNVTDNDLIITSKIVLAHLMEFPDYYFRLIELENEANKYWKHKKKPDIFLP
jgi:hypothetical protein